MHGFHMQLLLTTKSHRHFRGGNCSFHYGTSVVKAPCSRQSLLGIIALTTSALCAESDRSLAIRFVSNVRNTIQARVK
jgi:hypothetical protein